jgi:hypothetical protein
VFRRFFCRYGDCQTGFELVAGRLPNLCPVCGRTAMWSTTEGQLLKPLKRRPRVPFDLNLNDLRLLKRLRIAQV